MGVAGVYDVRTARRPLVPPRPPRAPEDMSTLAQIAALRANVISTWSLRAYQEEIIKARFLFRTNFVVNQPEAIRHVLVDNYENYTRTPPGIRVLRPILGQGVLTAEGRAWKHQRRTLAPAFTPRAVATLVPHMIAGIDDAIATLRANEDQPVDVRRIMQRMTLEIAGRTMFSFEMGRHGATLREFVMEYGERLARPQPLDLLLPLSWPSPLDFSRARFRKRWIQFMSTVMAERRAIGKKEGAPARDLFDLLDAARDPETGAAFSEEQLRDEVATMILAGHETTATALFWALYLLALDPATQDEVVGEARRVAATGAADLDRLRFTRAVIEETMRLYPPVFLIARAAAAPDSIGGLPVRKGDAILISPWLLHRHEKLWTDPDAFIPARFMAGAPQPDRFAYLPFGVGPRVCIGAHFAMVEATLALAKLIETFHFSLIDKKPAIAVGVVTTQPDYSPMFSITRR